MDFPVDPDEVPEIPDWGFFKYGGKLFKITGYGGSKTWPAIQIAEVKSDGTGLMYP